MFIIVYSCTEQGKIPMDLSRCLTDSLSGQTVFSKADTGAAAAKERFVRNFPVHGSQNFAVAANDR
jgi:hypothetical protein